MSKTTHKMDPSLLALIGSLIVIVASVANAYLSYRAQRLQADQADSDKQELIERHAKKVDEYAGNVEKFAANQTENHRLILRLNEEIRIRSEKIEELTKSINDSRDGGDGYCWVNVETFGQNNFLFRVINEGKYALEDLTISVVDNNKWAYLVDNLRGVDVGLFDSIAQKEAITHYHLNSIAANGSDVLSPHYPRVDSEYYSLGFNFSAKNGRWYQSIYIYRPEPTRWIYASRVRMYKDNKEIILRESLDPAFPIERFNKGADGNPIW